MNASLLVSFNKYMYTTGRNYYADAAEYRIISCDFRWRQVFITASGQQYAAVQVASYNQPPVNSGNR